MQVDTHADSILSAEQRMMHERDEALLKRSKQTEMLKTLQEVINQYADFLSAVRHPGH